MIDCDFTHDPARRSWLESANVAGADFPIQNLPFGVFRRRDSDERFRGGIAIGDRIVDLKALSAGGVLDGDALEAAKAGSLPQLNELMALGRSACRALRHALSKALQQGSTLESRLRSCLVAQAQAEFAVPARIGDFTDFFASIHHATNTGRLARPDDPLPRNYKWMPIAYHGRSSSIVVSGEQIVRPFGQRLPRGEPAAVFEPSRRLDFELELGFFVGAGNTLGGRIDIARADASLFGACLLNDWSARDIQAWESQPLGPFLAKNFATTLSPWIITMDALAPYRQPHLRPDTDPAPLPYLDAAQNRVRGAIDIQLSVALRSAAMRQRGAAPVTVSRSSFGHAYWTIAQMVAHHTVGGCNLRPGDLLGTGTQSGPGPHEAGSLLELTRGGRTPIPLGDEQRGFLEDGDEVVFSAWCEKPGAARIGFGEARGEIVAARIF